MAPEDQVRSTLPPTALRFQKRPPAIVPEQMAKINAAEEIASWVMFSAECTSIIDLQEKYPGVSDEELKATMTEAERMQLDAKEELANMAIQIFLICRSPDYNSVRKAWTKDELKEVAKAHVLHSHFSTPDLADKFVIEVLRKKQSPMRQALHSSIGEMHIASPEESICIFVNSKKCNSLEDLNDEYPEPVDSSTEENRTAIADRQIALEAFRIRQLLNEYSFEIRLEVCKEHILKPFTTDDEVISVAKEMQLPVTAQQGRPSAYLPGNKLM